MRRPPLTEAEERAFTTMWAAGVSAEDIMQSLQIGSINTVSSIRARLGLPSRARQRAITREAAPGAPAPGAPVVPKMPPHPYWDAVRDLAVLQTAGRHRAIEALARELGRPRTFVLQRWHLLRAA